jgi:hypothetical protein
MQIRFSAALLILVSVSAVSAGLHADPSVQVGQAAPAQDNADQSKSTSATPPPAVTVIDAVDARGILGRYVRSPSNEDMGRIVDVVVDRGGHVRAAVVDFGGFLGVGSRKIVVDWSALRFDNIANKAATVGLELTRDQVRAAPEYKDDQPIVVLGASGSLEPLRDGPPAAAEK